jgi:hypothetical protein
VITIPKSLTVDDMKAAGYQKHLETWDGPTLALQAASLRLLVAYFSARSECTMILRTFQEELKLFEHAIKVRNAIAGANPNSSSN